MHGSGVSVTAAPDDVCSWLKKKDAILVQSEPGCLPCVGLVANCSMMG